jgi:hypothetical protein
VAAATGSSSVFAATQALKYAQVYSFGTSGAFMPTQVLAYAVTSAEGFSDADIRAVKLQVGGLLSEGAATSRLTGLGLVRFIEAHDMERGAEQRSMDRGEERRSMEVI